jgi:hypothetical protein
MSKSSEQVPQPPKPPGFGRELELRRLNVIGVGLLALLVLLALLGVFGHSPGEASNEGEVLALEATYPTRIRFKSIDAIEVRVWNAGRVALQTVTVLFDPVLHRQLFERSVQA